MLKEVLKRPGIRFFLWFIVLLWIAAGTQFIAQKVFVKQGNILEAFAVSDFGTTESRLEITASCNDKYLSRQDKENLIACVAKKLSIAVDTKPLVVTDANREEVSFVKEAKRARTVIKTVTLADGSQYLMTQIVIYEDSRNDIVEFQKLLEEIFIEAGFTKDKINTTLVLCGTYDGKLTLPEKNKIADDMIRLLKGKVVFENREDELYTVYAYTGLMKEYVVADKTRINIQVAITYEEQTDRTKVYLATPVISGDW